MYYYDMKKIILYFLTTGVSLAVTAYVVPGINISGSFQGLAIVTVVFTVVMVVVKPILKMLSLPIEIATLGLFTIVINTFLFLLIDFLLVPITITDFWFPGLAYGPLIIAPVRIPALVTALLGSMLISSISAVLVWLTD